MYRLATKCTENMESNTSDVNKAKRLFVRRAVCPVGYSQQQLSFLLPAAIAYNLTMHALITDNTMQEH